MMAEPEDRSDPPCLDAATGTVSMPKAARRDSPAACTPVTTIPMTIASATGAERLLHGLAALAFRFVECGMEIMGQGEWLKKAKSQ